MQPAGVAVVVIRAPVGCRASGATKFLTEQSPVAVLVFATFRMIISGLHFFTKRVTSYSIAKSALFLEGVKFVDVCELEANEFCGSHTCAQ